MTNFERREPYQMTASRVWVVMALSIVFGYAYAAERSRAHCVDTNLLWEANVPEEARYSDATVEQGCRDQQLMVFYPGLLRVSGPTIEVERNLR